eukprot:TRINITY_DN3861_c0_g1_i1.p1 TRINITY_DN3861_c0_g1~~TRINITY_DN3861_c0_g1_i1.p1  ORF type:complete len:329 (-),score=76.04 TRINITY_DN3861_c0_g1_i1:28-1014(-)
MSLDLSGIYPPVPTPFTVDGDVDYTALENNIRQLMRTCPSLSGIVVLGSNGEAALLSEEEKISVVSTARKAVPHTHLLIAGASHDATRETIRAVNRVADLKVDAVLVLPPSYYKSQMTDEVIVKYFCAVADQVKCPVIMYNMPANTGIDMSARAVVEASKHPNIIGLKDSSGNVERMKQIRDEIDARNQSSDQKDSFQILAGSAGFLHSALDIGAVGGICAFANIAPQILIDLLTRFKSGDKSGSLQIQEQIKLSNEYVTRRLGVAGLKSSMECLSGFEPGTVRAPLIPLTPEKRIELLAVLISANVITESNAKPEVWPSIKNLATSS